jgi:hypothetical protein
MKVKLGVLAGVLAVALGLAATAATLARSAKAAPPTATVTSTITPAQSGAVLNGVFAITNFTKSNGQLVANGVFSGTANGRPVTTPASAAVSEPPPNTCRILDVMLGRSTSTCLGSWST